MSLTERQLEVLRGLLNDQSAKAIAESLNCSVQTVKNHITAIYRYLGIYSRGQLLTLKMMARGFVLKTKKAKGAGA